MKKLLHIYLFVCCVAFGHAQLTATIDGGNKSVTIDCKNAATVSVSNMGKTYIATALNGALIVDPDTGDEVSLIFSDLPTFQVRAVFGGGTILVTDAMDNADQDTVDVAVTPLSNLVGEITGSSCMSSDGTMQLSITSDPRAGDVVYSWFIQSGGQYTRIEGARDASTVSLKSLNPGTSTIGVRITNDCSGDLCSSVTRSFLVRKILSESDKQIAIRGPECASDDVLGQDNIIVLAIPPVLGLNDAGQYQWRFPADKLEQEFASADGSALALRVLDNTEDITVFLDLGPACNPGLVYTKIIKARPTVPIIAMQEGIDFVIDQTFCLPTDITTERVFEITNNTDDNFQYEWIVPSGWEIINPTPDNTQVTIRFANNSSGNITVRATNDGCGDEFSTVNINRYASTPLAITGADPNCINFGDITPVTFTVSGGSNTYNWNVQLKDQSGNLSAANWTVDVTSGSQGNGSQITYIPSFDLVDQNSSSFVITASIIGDCGSTTDVTSELEVAIGPGAPSGVAITYGSITESVMGADFCFISGEEYILKASDIDFADGYSWSLGNTTTGWSITTPSNAQQITLTAGSEPVSISVVATANGCANSEAFSFNGAISPQKPSDITVVPSSSNTCISPSTGGVVTLGVTDISGANFTWNLPATSRYTITSGQGTNQIVLTIAGDPNTTINDPLPGPISVTVNSSSGSCTATSNPFVLTYGDAPDISGGRVNFIPGLLFSIDQLGTPLPDYVYEWSVADATGVFVVDPNYVSNAIVVTGALVGNVVQVRVIDTVSGCESVRLFDPQNPEDTGAMMKTEESTMFSTAFREKALKISPNPAKEYVNVNLGTAPVERIYIIDVSGKLVYEGSSSKSSIKLNITDYPAGVYTVIAISGQEDFMKKIMIH